MLRRRWPVQSTNRRPSQPTRPRVSARLRSTWLDQSSRCPARISLRAQLQFSVSEPRKRTDQFDSSGSHQHCGLHRFRQHRNRRQDHPRRTFRHRHHSRGAQGTRRGRHQDRVRRLDARRRVQPRAHPARHPPRAAQPHARRRQERRRHQPRARRARDGVHAPPHQRLRHRRRRQRLPVARRKAQAVRQEGLRGRRTRLHEHHPAAELPRVHRLREPRATAVAARPRRRAEPAAPVALSRHRPSRRHFRSCGAR